MTATVIEGFGKGEWDAVSVVASITSDPVAARCVLESPAFLDALVPLLTSPEGRVIQAAWGIVANLSGIPGFGAAMLSKGAFNSIHSILAAGPAPLQTSAVEAMGKMCLADHILAGALLRESVVMKLAEFCNTADPALQLTALAVCADVFLCYPPFYPEFMKVGGLDAVLNAAASSATAPAARERAVFILTCAVSTSEANKNALANTVPVFTDTLFSATGPARTHAAAGLGFFAQWLSPADERAILDSGSVLALVAAAAAAGSNSAQQQQQQQSPETAAAALAESVVQRRTALDTLNKLLSRSPSCCAAALESSAITTAKDALKEGEDATLHAPALGVLSCLLQSAPAATQAEFCAGGGLELLTGLCSRDASVKDAAMGLLADLSAKNPQAAAQYSKLGSLGDVLPLLGAQDLRVRERALAVVAGLAAHDPAGVTQELAAKRCLPPVIATFVAAPLATPAKRDSLIIIAAAWQSGCSEALTQLASFQAAQYVVPVLASDDSATTVPALVVLSLAHLTEDRIVPGSLTTPIALTNLCRAAAAAATTTTTSSKKDDDGNSDDEDDDDDDGTKSESALDQLLDNGKKKKELNYGNEEKLLASKMALYILSVLLKKYPDAVRPHLCSENAVPSLFANLCTITTTTTTTNNNNNNDNSNINNSDTIDSFVGVILLALRRCPELRDRLLAMPGAHRGIDVLLAACEPLPPSSQLLLSSSPPSQPSPTARAAISAEVLFILAGAPGNVFAAIVERANYARAASALTAHLASPSPSMYTVRSLLVVICAVLRNECARPHIAAALSFEALSGLLTSSSSSSSPDNNRDVQDAHNLAVSATGVLASTNIFRAAQASRAGEWAGILTGLLAGAAEDAAVRTLSIAVGLAPCAAFRKAFCVCDALVEQAAEAARNVYAPRAQVLALRLLALLHVGVEQTQGVFEATVGQAQPNTAVVAEALRYYAGLLSPEALWEFFGVEGRVKALWDAHCVCTTPAPLLALLTLCTTLAENDGLREVLAKLISGDALAKLAASFPFATDYAAVLKTCIGI